MNGRGGACIARYTGGFNETTYNMSKVEKIMLKYRPIAPKPMATRSGSSSSTVDHADGNQRRKRRYVRVNGNKKKKDTNTVSKKRKVHLSPSENSDGREGVVTLSLMHDTTASPATSSENSLFRNDCVKFNKPRSPLLLSFNNYQQTACESHVDHKHVIDHLLPSPVPQLKKSVVTSFVTMESVTETWMEVDGLGFTDQARVMSMEMDKCPSFITDSRDIVVWTNKAYREMTGGGGDNMVLVKKVNQVTMPVSDHVNFTCKVKVIWGTERDLSPSTVTTPCDVWWLRNGGYAWQLDVKTALCLGRYS